MLGAIIGSLVMAYLDRHPEEKVPGPLG
jgi:hypothetical protein